MYIITIVDSLSTTNYKYNTNKKHMIKRVYTFKIMCFILLKPNNFDLL